MAYNPTQTSPLKAPSDGFRRLFVTSGADPIEALPEELKRLVDRVLIGRELTIDEALEIADFGSTAIDGLSRAAFLLRDIGKGRNISFSPKVFIPLTRLCRDFCSYCTFRQSPSEAESLYMTTGEVLNIARAGQRLGCTEALLTLGERPEQRYPQARRWLSLHGYKSTLDYASFVCRQLLEETSLLPHSNPGTMSRREMTNLKDVNASLGVMLESSSETLCQKGGPHHRAPSKWPKVRMKTLNLAGQLKIPFTTGILIGIGEDRRDRISSLLAIRESHRNYGHIQEVIIQNFRAKSNTEMHGHPDPSSEDLLWTVAVARLILGPTANIQVPPNLNPSDYPLFLLAGINDWGGVSPLTIDHVNPEAPWPQLSELRRLTESMGFQLRPRLPVYPEYIADKTDYLPQSIRQHLAPLVDAEGYVKGGIEQYASATA